MASKALIGGIVAGAIGLVLVVTNPSLADFSARMDAENGFLSHLTCRGVETGNYVLFSRYEYQCMTETKKYVGVLGNYFRLDSKPDANQS
jgi:tricorn protease-like protein